MPIYVPKIIGLTSFNTENLNIDNNSITAYNSSIEQVSYTDISSNLITYSEDLTQSYWGKGQSTITGNTSVAPDGTTTADTLTANAGTTTYSHVKAQGLFTQNVNHTFSVHVKAGTHSFVSLGSNNTFSFGQFNLSNGTVISLSLIHI